MFRHCFCLLAIGLIVSVLGCGSGTATLSGSATLDGKPIENGSISVSPVGAPGAQFAGKIENGRYSIDMAPNAVGEYRVEIRWPKPTGKQIPVEDDPPNTIEEMKDAVPAKYNDESTLTVTLKSGSNTEDFALTSN